MGQILHGCATTPEAVQFFSTKHGEAFQAVHLCVRLPGAHHDPFRSKDRCPMKIHYFDPA